MPQINVSISFSSETEMHLYDAINTGKRSATVKQAIEFWLKYKDLLPELDNTADLLSMVAHIASEQARMMDMIKSGVVVAERTEDSSGDWLDGQLDMMGEFE